MLPFVSIQTSGPILTFASRSNSVFANVRIIRTTSKYMFLVEF